MADLALAVHLMRSGKYKSLVISTTLDKTELDFGCDGELYLKLIADLTSNRHSKLGPSFMTRMGSSAPLQQAALDKSALLRSEQLGLPTRLLSVISVCCGVSGDGLALEASGCDPKRSLYITSCPEDTAVLQLRFPYATIIQGDIRDPRMLPLVMTVALAFGGFDIAMIAVLCQPSSDASTIHDPSDERLATGLMLSLIHI